MPSRPIGSSDPHTSFSGSFWLLSKQRPLAVIQRPEKSGWPSAVFGAGAVRLNFPSAVLGTLGVGYFSHCAPAVPLTARTATSANIARSTEVFALHVFALRIIDLPPLRLRQLPARRVHVHDRHRPAPERAARTRR